MAAQLRAGLYKGSPDRVLLVGDFISVSDAEIEDLFPQEFIAKLMTRYLQRLLAIQDDDFHEVVESGKPIIPQVEAYAMKNGIALPESWKVDIAKMAKESLLKIPVRSRTILVSTLGKTCLENMSRFPNRLRRP